MGPISPGSPRRGYTQPYLPRTPGGSGGCGDAATDLPYHSIGHRPPRLRPPPRGFQRTVRRHAGLALVAVAAFYTALQHAVVRRHHREYPQLPTTFGFLSKSGTDGATADQTIPGILYSRRLVPDEIFGPSPPALPATEDHRMDELRNERFDFGGGQGDPRHLGGFDAFDKDSLSPAVWRWMVETAGVKSVLDVGCGRGWSTSWFLHQGVDALCIEGSHDAVSQNAVSDPKHLVEHDFTLGPWWPDETYDAAWVTGFIQQVSLHHAPNYIPALRKTALLFVDTPQASGWHRVEVHPLDFWIRRFEMFGWRFEPSLTTTVRELAEQEIARSVGGPDGLPYAADMLARNMMVFVNPEIARLPQHTHLFPEPGCFKSRNKATGTFSQRECATGGGVRMETSLHPSFRPLELSADGEKRWWRRVQKLLTVRRPLLPRGADLQTFALDDDSVPRGGRLGEDLPPIDADLDMSSFLVERIPLEIQQGHDVSSLPKVHVMVWPLIEFGSRTAESRSVETDGIQQSAWLEMATDMFDFDPNVVWVGDTGYAYGFNAWCGKFNELIVEAKRRRAKLKLPLQWPVFIVNFSDGHTFQKCLDVEESVGPHMVRYSTRSIVLGRKWNNETQWVESGERKNLTYMGSSYRHTPLIVRTDTIATLAEVLRERHLTLSSRLETLPRDYDIAHLWPHVETEDDLAAVGDVESRLRTRVSRAVAHLAANRSLTAHGATLRAYVGLAGKASTEGRQSVAREYIEGLLGTKIIVVTQRDAWEDHYRLFEGLVSGAMVMCDRMLSLPAGLKNGAHLIEFTSEQDLVQKALYYLEHDDERLNIAFEGRRLAMSRHRSWHRMEEIIFGDPLTVCHELEESSCPYIVNANETDGAVNRTMLL